MCGITGAVGFVDDTVVDAVRRADAAQAHRGPDGSGFWQSPATPGQTQGVVLAHRRLAILDLSPAGAQPMHDEATGAVVVFNGEIYNFKSVREELRALGHAFHSECDTEVVLKGCIEWGEACVNKLRGMFAFAFWNPVKRDLLIARDRLGVKPLYWSMIDTPGGGRTVYFASELRSLLATGRLPRRLDPAGLARYLWHGFVPEPGTIIQGIQMLAPGSVVTIDAASPAVEPKRYWQLPGASIETDGEAQVKRELENAVGMRLIADVPLGVFLSGGIDSSAVAAIASRVAGDAVKTFTVGFDVGELDESAYAQAVADQLGTQHTRVVLTEQMFMSQLDAALDSIDQPTFDAINTYFVSRAVREAGITVALAGTGGDELFGGYKSFVDLPTGKRWGRRMAGVPEGVLRAAAGAVARHKTGRAGAVPPQTRWDKLGDVLACRGDLVKLYQVSYALFTESMHTALLNGTADTETSYGMMPGTLDELRTMTAGNPDLHAITMLELQSFIGQRLLRDTDAASMAVGLEVRVPLLDHALVEAVAKVDPATRFEPLGKKRLLRKIALEGLDPAQFDRPKSGFVLPIDTWCRQGFSGQIRATLCDADAARSLGLSSTSLAALWQAFEDKAPGIYWSRVWAMYVLIRWCQRNNVSMEAA